VPSLKKKGNKLIGLCPFHKEKTPSFHVSVDKKMFYCFGCKASGNVFSFISMVERLDFPESVKFIADLTGIEITETKSGQGSLTNVYYKLNSYAMNFYNKYLNSSEGRRGMKYLEGRGIEKNTIEKFKLGYAPGEWRMLTGSIKKHLDDPSAAEKIGLINSSDKEEKKHYYDRFRDRIIFPIFDRQERIIGFGGRVIDEGTPKYLNSPESEIFKKRDVLYGFNLAKEHVAELNRAIVVEGYFDVIGCHQAGLYNVIAPLGTALTLSQVQLISRYCSEIILLFDSDSAGVNAALKSVDLFKEINADVRIAVLPEGDPFDYISEKGLREFMTVIDTSLKPADFRISLVMKEMKSRGKIEILKELFAIVNSMSLESEKSEYLNEISNMLNIDEKSVRADFNKFYKSRTINEAQYDDNKDATHDFLTKSYRDLIKLICSYPDLIEKASVDFSTDDITDEDTRILLKTVLEIYFTEQGFSVDKMFDFFKDEIDIDFLNKSLVNEFSVDNPDIAYNEIYSKIRLYRVDDEINRLVEAVKKTGENKDSLLEEIEILRREKEKLASFIYNTK
jgi:DNA primase